LPLAAGQFRSW